MRGSASPRSASRAVAYYENGVKRIDGDWAGTGVTGSAFLDPEHPFAADLDLFGVGSLFERLCTARTRSGEERLASWLLNPVDPDTVRARQAAVAELRPKLDFRETIAVLSADVREGIDPEGLIAWSKEPSEFTARWPFYVMLGLAVLGFTGLAMWVATDLGSPPFVAAIVLELAFAMTQRAKVERVLKSLRRRSHDLVLIAELLARLETETFTTPMLVKLADSLRTGGEPASRRVARLRGCSI